MSLPNFLGLAKKVGYTKACLITGKKNSPRPLCYEHWRDIHRFIPPGMTEKWLRSLWCMCNTARTRAHLIEIGREVPVGSVLEDLVIERLGRLYS